MILIVVTIITVIMMFISFKDWSTWSAWSGCQYLQGSWQLYHSWHRKVPLANLIFIVFVGGFVWHFLTAEGTSSLLTLKSSSQSSYVFRVCWWIWWRFYIYHVCWWICVAYAISERNSSVLLTFDIVDTVENSKQQWYGNKVVYLCRENICIWRKIINQFHLSQHCWQMMSSSLPFLQYEPLIKCTICIGTE